MFSMDSKGINLPSNEAKTATAEKFSPLLKNVLEAKVVLLGDTDFEIFSFEVSAKRQSPFDLLITLSTRELASRLGLRS
jgi:hypothetical protein